MTPAVITNAIVPGIRPFVNLLEGMLQSSTAFSKTGPLLAAPFCRNRSAAESDRWWPAYRR
jgi:hypothetical protein